MESKNSENSMSNMSKSLGNAMFKAINFKDSDVHDLKRMREEITMEIRKKKRLQILENKKNQLEIAQKTLLEEEEFKKLKLFIDEMLKKKFDVSELIDVTTKVKSKNRFEQHYGVIGLRKLLSESEGAPIQQVIDANVTHILINFMKNDEEPHLQVSFQSLFLFVQLESTWAITNIASGQHQHVQSLIDKGIIVTVVNLVTHQVTDIAEQALWCIGNIAGDSSSYRDILLEHGCLQAILELLDRISQDNFDLLKVLTWVLSNLCRGKPIPEIEKVKDAIPFFCKVIQQFNEKDILQDSLWAMSYLSDGNEELVDEVLQTGVLNGLVKHLEQHTFEIFYLFSLMKQMSVLMPCLRIIGNIVTGTEEQTQQVIDMDIIPKLFILLDHEKTTVRKECCWILSNITAGSSIQIGSVFSDIGKFQKLARLSVEDQQEVIYCLPIYRFIKISREAIWTISNSTSKASPEQVKSLVDAEILQLFVLKLSSEDYKTVAIVLEALKNVMYCGAQHFAVNDENPFQNKFEELGGLDMVEKLQRHPDNSVYQKSYKFLDQFYELESEI